ncbi:MAG: Holliday junction branch migration protein RuvA [Pseudomonadales bacterium]|nr:Holliday junction branch migration protein RuvA [Pseudomonadales bacterium]
MIGRLAGTLVEIEGNTLLLDVGGIGYEIEVSANVLGAGPLIGAELILYTHFVVREDAQLLFGFCDRSERDLYRTYIRINGVGPKMGLALISSIDPGTLSRAVQNNEVGVLTKVPGVGKKTAERLMVELKSRIDTLIPQLPSTTDMPMPSFTSRAVYQEAEDALLALGYKGNQAQQAIMQARQDFEQKAAQANGATKEPSTEQIVTWVLRQIARSGV